MNASQRLNLESLAQSMPQILDQGTVANTLVIISSRYQSQQQNVLKCRPRENYWTLAKLNRVIKHKIEIKKCQLYSRAKPFVISHSLTRSCASRGPSLLASAPYQLHSYSFPQTYHQTRLIKGAYCLYGLFTLALNLRQLCQQQRQVTATIVLALATLGNGTQIGLFLFMLRCPRWPRQVSIDCHQRYCETFDNVNMALCWKMKFSYLLFQNQKRCAKSDV